jgi:hypothetical protein
MFSLTVLRFLHANWDFSYQNVTRYIVHLSISLSQPPNTLRKPPVKRQEVFRILTNVRREHEIIPLSADKHPHPNTFLPFDVYFRQCILYWGYPIALPLNKG